MVNAINPNAVERFQVGISTASPRKPFISETPAAASMMHSPVRIPGMKPAMNMAAIETEPAATEYTIMTLLGGIIRPVVAAVVVTATLKSRS